VPNAGRGCVRSRLSEDEAAEERRLWADYYDAVVRALDIMRLEGTAQAAATRIIAEAAAASQAITRIKEIRGIN